MIHGGYDPMPEKLAVEPWVMMVHRLSMMNNGWLTIEVAKIYQAIGNTDVD